MRFLPRANPLYEKISATKLAIPDVLEKLGKGGFTGYLSHTTADSEVCCIFAKGKLLCAVSREVSRKKTGFEALMLLFDKVLSAGGEINVYRMTPDLAMCAHALLVGVRLFQGEDVRQADIKGLLAHLKNNGLNGAVLFYTPERFAIMFYKDGLPIGFYHDGATAIESLSDEFRKVAALPGAQFDACSTKPLDELLQYDLLEMVNLEKLWVAAQFRNSANRQKEQPSAEPGVSTVDDQRLLELVEDLNEVASAYLTRAGRDMVEKRIKEGGGAALLLDSSKLTHFLTQIEADARAADSHARIDEMLDLMKSEIAGRLAI